MTDAAKKITATLDKQLPALFAHGRKVRIRMFVDSVREVERWLDKRGYIVGSHYDSDLMHATIEAEVPA